MKLLLSILFLGISQIAIAQTNPWVTSIAEARELAAEKELPILLVFSGSDWCKGCILLDRNVFTDESFLNSSGKSFIPLRADFPRKKKNRLSDEATSENNKLASEFNPNGTFPHLVLLHADGQRQAALPIKYDSANELLSQISTSLKQLESVHE